MKEKYLPIGSVVLLRGANKRLMITGYCSVLPEDEETVYDYTGCLFPESNVAREEISLFNHEQIEKIIHFGLIDDEFSEFNKLLIEAMSEEMSDTKDNNISNTSSDFDMFGDVSKLPPLTPENFNAILNMAKLPDKNEFESIEPKPINLEDISIPSLSLPKISSDSLIRNNEAPVSNKKPISVNDIDEDTIEVGDGKPALQLVPIFDVLDTDVVEIPEGNND